MTPNEVIHKLTIRFNLDLKQRSEVRELIKDIARVKSCDTKNAAEEVMRLMENKHKSIAEIREIYGIQKLCFLKEFSPDDVS
ncbi:hypothetical protein [Clostridium kluyveri]|uniref:hypothetical protein n=1 Tax=Clostridium kluyveri TaxID=1534 RepID=UPI002246E968|nr:hypothetical protein [Clostridium kluyveri]UZQ49832.1 hypothetical protein OP486_18080 [Clostridium kluyveri]